MALRAGLTSSSAQAVWPTQWCGEHAHAHHAVHFDGRKEGRTNKAFLPIYDDVCCQCCHCWQCFHCFHFWLRTSEVSLVIFLVWSGDGDKGHNNWLSQKPQFRLLADLQFNPCKSCQLHETIWQLGATTRVFGATRQKNQTIENSVTQIGQIRHQKTLPDKSNNLKIWQTNQTIESPASFQVWGHLRV